MLVPKNKKNRLLQIFRTLHDDFLHVNPGALKILHELRNRWCQPNLARKAQKGSTIVKHAIKSEV